ncbi:MAG: DNA polymerase III subunit gamma/tau [Dehalococcoidia bacterium]|nr:DNA polymerase III subunit gamma/tau [Dehalococcoidia bacterium]
MAVEVLYRKYRPQSFSELAGQDPIARTLRNAVAAGKVAHAYLFSGPRGTGKTSSGRLLAKAVNCSNPQDGEPCNVCDSCLSFLEGRAIDLIELDAASNRGVDDIRNLRDNVGFAPAVARFKVYIIDEAHMLTEQAFNALLKTLEEPPPHVLFVLATTEPHKIPATIASRCQRFDFRRIPLEAAVARLETICEQEGIACPKEALELVARAATGSMRDAINLLEQAVDYHGRDLSVDAVRSGLGLSGDARSAELARLTLEGDLPGGLILISSVRDDGLDLRQFQRQVVSYLRELLLVHAGAENTLSLTKEQAAEMKKLVKGVSRDELLRALQTFAQADLRADPLSPLPLEIALTECVLTKQRVAATAPASQPAPEAAPAAPPAAAPSPEPKPPVSRSRPATAAASETRDAAPIAEPERAPASEATPVQVPIEITAPASEELARVQAEWEHIYRLTRQKNQKAGALLNSNCAIVGMEGKTIVLAFQHQMLAEKMNSDDNGANIQAVREVVQEVLGSEYDIRCVLDPDAVVAQRAARRGSAVRGGHLVEAAREMGARLVNEGE